MYSTRAEDKLMRRLSCGHAQKSLESSACSRRLIAKFRGEELQAEARLGRGPVGERGLSECPGGWCCLDRDAVPSFAKRESSANGELGGVEGFFATKSTRCRTGRDNEAMGMFPLV